MESHCVETTMGGITTLATPSEPKPRDNLLPTQRTLGNTLTAITLEAKPLAGWRNANASALRADSLWDYGFESRPGHQKQAYTKQK